MSEVPHESKYFLNVDRDSYLEACRSFKKFITRKADKKKVVKFSLDGDDIFHITWGNVSLGVKAHGNWDSIVSINGSDFLAILLYPPAGDPLVFKVIDNKFYCNAWSCSCIVITKK